MVHAGYAEWRAVDPGTPWNGNARLSFSLVLPAYNEVQRLPRYLEAIRDYLTSAFGIDYEVIVVDDGSADGLADRIRGIAEFWPQLRLLRHTMNQGKGAAVRTGILAAAGDLLLFADADGASPIEEERRLRDAIAAGAEIASGSRIIDVPGVQRRRSPLRKAMGGAFRWLARRLVAVPVQDTQCGFKMFRRTVGQQIFRLCDEHGYLFDVQVLALAARLGYRIDEVGICWQHVEGSKVRLVGDSWKMWRGLWDMRRRVDRLVELVRMEAALEPNHQSECSIAAPECTTAESAAVSDDRRGGAVQF